MVLMNCGRGLYREELGPKMKIGGRRQTQWWRWRGPRDVPARGRVEMEAHTVKQSSIATFYKRVNFQNSK